MADEPLAAELEVGDDFPLISFETLDREDASLIDLMGDRWMLFVTVSARAPRTAASALTGRPHAQLAGTFHGVSHSCVAPWGRVRAPRRGAR